MPCSCCLQALYTASVPHLTHHRTVGWLGWWCCLCPCSETYQYYTLPFCLPDKKKYVTEDLGEVLEGDRLVNTPYEIKFNKDVESSVLCKKKLTGNDLFNIRMAITEDYYFQVHLNLLEEKGSQGGWQVAGWVWERAAS